MPVVREIPGPLPGPLHDGVAAEVMRLAGAAQASDGVEALGEATLLALRPGAGDGVVHLLATEGDDPGSGVIGYAQLDGAGAGRPSGELVVHPDHRRRGTGRALLDAAQAASAVGPLLWAHGDLPGARALAASAGLAVVRELWRMDRPLTAPTAADDRPGEAAAPLTDPPGLPDGVTVRAFRPGADDDALLAVNAAAFAHHPEQGRLTLADLHARQAEPWFDPENLLLAERDGLPVAFSWLKVEPGSATGELYVLGVAPAVQGTGLGRTLTALSIRHLRRQGLTTMILFTDAANAAAVRTYRSAGFVVGRTDVQYG